MFGAPRAPLGQVTRPSTATLLYITSRTTTQRARRQSSSGPHAQGRRVPRLAAFSGRRGLPPSLGVTRPAALWSCRLRAATHARASAIANSRGPTDNNMEAGQRAAAVPAPAGCSSAATARPTPSLSRSTARPAPRGYTDAQTARPNSRDRPWNEARPRTRAAAADPAACRSAAAEAAAAAAAAARLRPSSRQSKAEQDKSAQRALPAAETTAPERAPAGCGAAGAGALLRLLVLGL